MHLAPPARSNFVAAPLCTVPTLQRPPARPFLAAPVAARQPTVEHFAPPLLVETTDIIAEHETMPSPIWGSWCGACAGMWVGTTGAYAPSTGAAEPIAIADDGRTKLYSLRQICVEERVLSDSGDTMSRHVARAASASLLRREMADGSQSAFDVTESIDWDMEGLSHSQLSDGLFVFDGGSYSMGPSSLSPESGAEKANHDCCEESEERPPTPASTRDSAGEDEDEEEDKSNAVRHDDPHIDEGDAWSEEDHAIAADADEVRQSPLPGEVSVIEACLQSSGEERVRVRLTVLASLPEEEDFDSVPQQQKDGNERFAELNSEPPSSSAKELDIELLRVSVTREAWEGMPGQFVEVDQPEDAKAAQAASAGERLSWEALAGFWNCFEQQAMTVEDIDMRTGQLARLPVYTSREIQVLVRGGGCDDPSCSVVETSIEGGALMLPHNVVVQLSMGPHGGMQSGKTVEINVLWGPRPGLLLGMARRYSATSGELEEVVASSWCRIK